MNIIAVGDLHGEWGPLNALMAKQRPDIVFVCGDFGWWPKFDVGRGHPIRRIKEWSHRGLKVPGNTQVYFCDGNHEDHEDLGIRTRAAQYLKGYNGTVKLYDRVYYMPRGNMLTLMDGREVLFFGGAYSIDKNMRTPGHDWFPEEIPNHREFELAMSHERVDIVIAHTGCEEWIPDLTRGEKERDSTRGMLSEIVKKYKPSLFYHGHWHKYNMGEFNKTRWYSLDYPKHGNGRWWVKVPGQTRRSAQL